MPTGWKRVTGYHRIRCKYNLAYHSGGNGWAHERDITNTSFDCVFPRQKNIERKQKPSSQLMVNPQDRKPLTQAMAIYKIRLEITPCTSIVRIKSCRGCISGISSSQLKFMVPFFPPENRKNWVAWLCILYKLVQMALLSEVKRC